VACPFFVPVKRLDRDVWLHAPRLPLGDAYRGSCHAGFEPVEPSESSQDELCNCGYARGRCDRFPMESADAVRFSILSDHPGNLRLIYVLEKNHTPVVHGVIEDVEAESNLGGVLLAQARAFVDSYQNRNSRRSPSVRSSGVGH